jgi:hypothetical protein
MKPGKAKLIISKNKKYNTILPLFRGSVKTSKATEIATAIRDRLNDTGNKPELQVNVDGTRKSAIKSHFSR